MNCIQYVTARNNLRELVIIRLSAKMKWLNDPYTFDHLTSLHVVLNLVDKRIDECGIQCSSEYMADLILDGMSKNELDSLERVARKQMIAEQRRQDYENDLANLRLAGIIGMPK